VCGAKLSPPVGRLAGWVVDFASQQYLILGSQHPLSLSFLCIAGALSYLGMMTERKDFALRFRRHGCALAKKNTLSLWLVREGKDELIEAHW
jgi:hypothetical protein